MSGSMSIVRTLGATATLATLTLAAACGNSADTAASNATGAGSRATSSASKPAPVDVLGVASTSLGLVLVDSRGRTVYLLTADQPGHSSCSAQCLQYWPLVPTPAGTGVFSVRGIGAVLTTTKATNGAAMMTAGGWPLYTFVNDKGPGDLAGEGVKSFGGIWYAVSPSGKAVIAPAKPATTPATTATTTPAATPTATTSGGAGGGGNGY